MILPNVSKKNLFLACFIVVIAGLLGCSGKRGEIVGKWKVLTMDDGKIIYYSSEVRQFFYRPPFDNTALLEGTINFMEDGSIDATLDLSAFKGTWSLKGDSLTISKENAEKGESFEIHTRNDAEKKYDPGGNTDMIVLEEMINGKSFKIELEKINDLNTKN